MRSNVEKWVFTPLVILLLAVSCTAVHNVPTHELNSPFGWAVCVSREDPGSYDLTGGARDRKKGVRGTVTVLKSTGMDIRDDLIRAVEDYDIVLLDGSAGEFVLSRSIEFDSLCNKTIAGVNGARIRSEFRTDPEMLEVIAGAADRFRDILPGEDGMYTLSNGVKLRSNQYGAFAARQALLDHYGDETEQYAHSGMFAFSHSENIIVRNLAFEGTGTFKGMAEHLIRVRYGSKHIWIDHCLFVDASRCAISYASQSDFLTVSWCKITYSARSGDRTYGMLISSDDYDYEDEGHLNCTLAFNQWDNIWTRVPMARFGDIHVLNSLYTCPGTVGINPRMHSAFLIEGNWFEAGVRAFCRFKILATPPRAYTWKNNHSEDGEELPDMGEVTVPYPYTALDPEAARAAVLASAGPTLEDPLSFR